MSQSIIAFAAATLLLLVELLISKFSKGISPSSAVKRRFLAAACLLVFCLLAWLFGSLNNRVAAFTAVLLLAQAAFLSVAHAASKLGKTLAIFLSMLVLSSIFAIMIFSGLIDTRWKPKPGLMSLEYEVIKSKVIGGYAAEKFGGAKTLLIAAERLPEMNEKETLKVLDTLREALEWKVELTGVENIPVTYDKDGKVVLSLSPDVFNKIIAGHPDTQLVISLVGLPGDCSQMECMFSEEGPSFLLVNQYAGIRNKDFIKYLEDGRIAAIVVGKPGWKRRFTRNPSMPSDPQKAFDQRFSLLTPENIPARRRGR